MIDKLPPWVEIGGFFLTFVAGSINVIGLLGFQHQAISHLTGVSSFIGYELASGNWSMVLHLNLIVFSFVFGAVLGSLIVRDGHLLLGRRYGVALLVESALLFVSLYALTHGSTTGHFFAAAACGLQNAMTTTYSGAIVRTTHVSGLFTDMGIMMGNWLRGIPIHGRRMKLYFILTNGFIVGGILGAFAYKWWSIRALAMPAIITLILAIAYGLLMLRQRKILGQ
ncbi:MAG: YoaK family protein [Formosimonas sp.]